MSRNITTTHTPAVRNAVHGFIAVASSEGGSAAQQHYNIMNNE